VDATRRRDHKSRSIKQITQDPDPSSSQRQVARDDQDTYIGTNASLKMAVFFTEAVPLLLVLVLPLSVHAGFFSSFMGLLVQETQEEELAVQVDNSARYTPLLAAALAADPQKAIGGGDVTTVDGALVSTGPVGADEIAASENSGGEISVYTVREGDALSQIAEMYGVTTNTILWANDISKASAIQPGDTLVILPIVGVRHVVKDGDTLSTILEKYDADYDEVLAYNNLTSEHTLSVGDELMIPGGEINTPQKVAARPAPTKSSGVASKGALVHPLPGSVRTQGIHGYNGVDLAAPYGTPIRAAASGEVIVSKPSGWNGGYGTYIVIRHSNGTQTLYSHNSSNTVSAGDYVTQGQTIGYVGSTGRSTGNHVHFEVRGGNNPF